MANDATEPGKCYWFKQGHWHVACYAVSLKDARDYMRAIAPGTKCDGVLYSDSTLPKWSTGAITPSRQKFIEDCNKRWMAGEPSRGISNI